MKSSNFLSHLTAVALVTVLTGMIYASVQQGYRSSANDPQLQLARDVASRLSLGQPVDRWLPSDSVDIGQSLSPFVTLFNEQKQPIVSNGFLHHRMPSLPSGVFDAATRTTENVFSWQPEQGVRQAVVVKRTNGGPYTYVVAGRSLLEVEKREQNLVGMMLTGWLICLIIIAAHWVTTFFRTKNYPIP